MRRSRGLPTAAVCAMLAAAAAGGSWVTAARAAPEDGRAALVVERVDVTADGFDVAVRNRGRAPQAVAQVIVNDGVWPTRVEPTVELEPGELAHATLFYHWIEGEPYELKVIGSRGAVAKAEATPHAQPEPPAWPWSWLELVHSPPGRRPG